MKKKNSTLRFRVLGKSQIKHFDTGETEELDEFYLQKKQKWSLIANSEKTNFDVVVSGDKMQIWENANLLGTYPLPARIRSQESYPQILVEENSYRYAIDSAMAELGEDSKETREALYAVAQIVYIRAKSKQQNKNDFPFTDLTSHQKYAGILISDRIQLEKEDWKIDASKLMGDLFFHSRSGGKTFSQKIFSDIENGFPGINDIFYITQKPIDESDDWEARISQAELMKILRFTGSSAKLKKILQTERKENLRLKVNRIKGWNFLRSNYYEVKESNSDFIFYGKGLGHNVGLNMNGALVLSKKGFSRFEILDHYFPGISFASQTHSMLPVEISYVLLSTQGNLLTTSYPQFLEREIPLGSLMKILTSLAAIRIYPDLKKRTQTCLGGKDGICWKKEGHGKLNWEEAIAHSCNIYFSTLSETIPYFQFKKELYKILDEIGIERFLPKNVSKLEYSKILPGLNFALTMKISSLIRLLMYIDSPKQDPDTLQLKSALHSTFQIGTASAFHDFVDEKNSSELWGKTSTIVYGSNIPLSYGIFLGGNTNYKIILLCRRGNGNKAAYYAKKILEAHL